MAPVPALTQVPALAQVALVPHRCCKGLNGKKKFNLFLDVLKKKEPPPAPDPSQLPFNVYKLPAAQGHRPLGFERFNSTPQGFL